MIIDYIFIGIMISVILIGIGLYLRAVFLRLALSNYDHENLHEKPIIKCDCIEFQSARQDAHMFAKILIAPDQSIQNEWVYNDKKWEAYLLGATVIGIFWLPIILFLTTWGLFYFLGILGIKLISIVGIIKK